MQQRSKIKSKNINAAKLQPTIGTQNELVTEGGEVQFISQMIAESKRVKQKVAWFTTLVGIKSNYEELRKRLNSDIEVCNMAGLRPVGLAE